LRDCISEASFLEGENGTDDAGAFVDMLLRTPDATDDKLLVRYRQYCDHCYALLRNPLIWSAVESLATSLIEQGDHDAEAALAAMGDDCEALSDAAAIMRIEAIANDQLPIFDDADLLRQLQQVGLQIETLPSG